MKPRKHHSYKYTNKTAESNDQSFDKSLDAQGYAKLKAQWDRKLAKSGFEDIETPTGELTHHNIRTLAWANRDIILEFFLKLDTYLVKTSDLPSLHRKVLELYSAGKYINEITTAVHRSRTTVKNIIKKYKILILESY